MKALQVVQFGLFLLLLGFSVVVFSVAMILAGAVAAFGAAYFDMTDWAAFGTRVAVWGWTSIIVGSLVSGLGKMLCAAVPEEGCRNLVIASIVCDLILAGLEFGVPDSLMGALMMAIFNFLLVWVGYFLFLKFLVRMADNVGAPQVRRFVDFIYVLFGSCFAIPVVFFIFPGGTLLYGSFVAVAMSLLFNYTIYTLYRALPLYIEEVKAGITDPSESAEDREEEERKEREKGPGGGGAPSQARPPEEPQGEPPEGHLLYRIPKGLEPLHMAVKEGDRYKMELRISKGDDPRARVRHHLTPLHIAASVGVMNVADGLVKAGAPVDDTCELGLTPLYFAIQTNNPNMAGFLIDKGANLFHQNENGYTPLHWACCVPHPSFIGPDRVKMVNLLISRGADINARTHSGKTARDLAVENKLEEVTIALDRHTGHSSPQAPAPSSEEKPDIEETQASALPFTPFHGMELAILPKNLEPLHDAVKEGDPEKVQLYLSQGAEINDTLPGGIAPIHITAITGVMSVSEMLLRYGATVDDKCDYGLTPIFLCVTLNNLNMVGYLISRGADVNRQDDMGRTPLHWAAAVPHEKLQGGNRVKMVQFLLKSGADPTIRDQEQKSPRDLALMAEEEEVAELLGGDDEAEPEKKKDEDDGYYV